MTENLETVSTISSAQDSFEKNERQECQFVSSN